MFHRDVNPEKLFVAANRLSQSSGLGERRAYLYGGSERGMQIPTFFDWGFCVFSLCCRNMHGAETISAPHAKGTLRQGMAS